MPLESRHLLSQAIDYFKRSVEKNSMVRKVLIEDISFYRAIGIIYRYTLAHIKVYIADVYVLTASDVIEIISKYPDVDCIVVISNWDHYTDLAKDRARRCGIGVFTLNQFLVALNYDERKFLDTGIANAVEENT